MISLAENQFIEGVRTKPIISILEVRDKNAPDSPPIIWVYLERIEKYKKDNENGTIREASIQISYQLIHHKNQFRDFKASGFFGGAYSSWGNQISLTSTSIGRGAVCLDLPKGQRIGTYLMNEIVSWAKKWSDAEVREIELIDGQAWDGNKLRRNRFYEQFGIKFLYSDSEKKAGKSIPMKTNELVNIDTWKQNIAELNPVKFASIQMEKIEHLEGELTLLARNRNEFKNELARAYSNPLLWAIKMCWAKYYSRILWGLFLSVVAFNVWKTAKNFFS